MRWLDGIAGSMEMTLSKLQLGMNREDWRAIVHGVAELDMDREAWHAALCGVSKSQTRLSD